MSSMRLLRLKHQTTALLHTWFGGWFAQDAMVMVYILKVLLACFLALWISLRFELEQPKTALLTVVIVMQNRFGMVFTKSLYRLLGTAVGIACSFVLVALFAQERVLFLACMAVWIGVCTAGSMVFRHHQSYGFVLAGYTICIVGLPSTIDPTLTFDVGVTRISEIMVGLLSATLVSDLVWPQRMGEVLNASLKRRFQDFSALVMGLLQKERIAKPHQTLLKFVADVFDVETYRASSGFENDASRQYRARLAHVNAAFMHVSTSFHSLEQLMRRLQATAHPNVIEALNAYYQPVVDALNRLHHAGLDAAAMRQLVNQLRRREQAYMLETPTDANDEGTESKRMVATFTPRERMDFDTGVEYIHRFSNELAEYVDAYHDCLHASTNSLSAELVNPRPMSLHVDPLIAVLAGVRGALALLCMSLMWITLDWRSGIEAITIGVITSTLFATSPKPTQTIQQFVIGAGLGTAMLFVCNFYLLPDAQGMLMLGLALMPFIAIAAWFSTQPAISVVGAGAFIVFFLHIGFNATYNASPVAFMNDAIADAVAITMSGVMYTLIDLSTSAWARKRVSKALRGMIVEAALSTTAQDRTHIETRARDLVQRLGTTKRVADAQDKEVVDWLFSTLEMTYALQQCRQQSLGLNAQDVSRVIEGTLQEMAALFAHPSTSRRLVALAKLEIAMDALLLLKQRQHANQWPISQVLTALHSMRCVLLDRASVLARVAPIAQVGS